MPGPNGCSIKLNHNLLHMHIKSSLKTHARPSSETRRLNFSMCGYPSPYVLCKQESLNQERSGSVAECLTRPRGCRSKLHRHHCVVSLNKNIIPTLVLVQPGIPVPIYLKYCWWDVKNQIKQTNQSRLYISASSPEPSLFAYQHFGF